MLNADAFAYIREQNKIVFYLAVAEDVVWPQPPQPQPSFSSRIQNRGWQKEFR